MDGVEWTIAAEDDEGSPEVGMRMPGAEGKHGLPERPGTALPGDEAAVVALHHGAGRLVIDLPETDHQRLRPRDDERPAQAVDTLSSLDVTAPGVARGQHHQLGAPEVETSQLERRHHRIAGIRAGVGARK